MEQQPEEDIILIDKPEGITSFDCIRRMRKELKVKKIGHAGTLDPMASGLMILGISRGTKKLSGYIKLPKVYKALILLGEKRDTADMDGEILEEEKVKEITEEEIRKTLKSMESIVRIKAPVYSAIKQQGEKLYEAARKGKDVEPPEREMEIEWIEFKDHYQKGDKYIIEVEMKVGSGAYVRSIAEEIGRRLGYPATTYRLRRTRIGEYSIENAEKI